MTVEGQYTPKSRWRIFGDNLIGGFAWGVGSVLGAVVLFAVLGYITAKVAGVPVIGEFVYNILVEVEKLRGK